MEEGQWHYKDERTGKRLGPVGRSELKKLIADERIERSTLVWNPAMSQWASASSTDLAGLFGGGPPPLPAGEISRWAVYALALFPIWGALFQAIASVPLAAHYGVDPRTTFDHRAWLLIYVIGNGVLGTLDERNLERGGLKIRGAAFVAALIVPVYLFVSCRTLKRHAGQTAWAAFLPLLLWVASVIAAAVISPSLFDPDAPAILRPDVWF